MTPREGEPAPDLPGSTIERVLKTDRYACTLRVRLADGTQAVYKKSVVELPPGLRVGPAARHLARREADHLERLADVHGVPALLSRPAPDVLVRQWINGATLREMAEIPDAVFPNLRRVLSRIHDRGVAYADLAKEDNLIIDPDAFPWFVDFQISVSRDSPLGGLVNRLQKADRTYLARHVKRRRPDQLTDEERLLLDQGPGMLRRLHRVLLKKPYNLLTRRIVRRWSGAGEGRRAGEPRGLRDT